MSPDLQRFLAARSGRTLSKPFEDDSILECSRQGGGLASPRSATTQGAHSLPGTSHQALDPVASPPSAVNAILGSSLGMPSEFV